MKPASEKVLVLIDYEVHTRGGHFGHWLAYFACEFSRRFHRVLVCTPDPEATRQLLQASFEGLPANLEFPGLPVSTKRLFSRRFRKRSLGKIFHDVAKLAPATPLCGFVMWGYDLLEDNLALNPRGVPWGTLANFSWEHRKFVNDAAIRDSDLRQLCQNDPNCVGVMVSDNFIVSAALHKCLLVPAMENLGLPETRPPATEEVRRLAAGRPVVGATGMLNGKRCVNELLRLSREHPGLFFFLAGKMDRDSVQADLLPILSSEQSGNVFHAEGYLEEKKLNAMLDAMDLVFIDGLNYPVQSSISFKALHFGKFILTPESNSWCHDAIRKWGVGMAYARRTENIREAWEKWRNSGGPERARAAAGELMSAGTLAACFDGMTRALTNPADLPEK